MPVPPNTTALTATAITLPAHWSQDASDGAGTTYDLWFTFTAPAGAVVIGAWGFSSVAAAYQPTIVPYVGPASSPTQILGINAINVPIQFPVTPGSTYLIQLQHNTNTPPATMTLDVLVAPTTVGTTGDILVPDETADGFPLPVLSGTADYTVKQFLPGLVEGQQGDLMTPSGDILMYDSFVGLNFVLYDPTITPIATIASMNGGTGLVRGNRTLNAFYIANIGTHIPAVGVQARSVSMTGATGPVHSISGTTIGMTALCPNNAGTILYWAGFSGSLSSQIKRWDLVNDVALSDLVGAVASNVAGDILVMTDGTLLVMYYTQTFSSAFVRHYDATGTTLNTYTLTTTAVTAPRLAYALDDPNSFWAWTHATVGTDPVSRFLNIRVSDGAILTTRNQMEYEAGAYTGAVTATPRARFGNAQSCPFFILPAAPIPPPTPGPAACPIGLGVGASGTSVCVVPWTSENA